MHSLLTFLMFAALGATVLVLVSGIVNLFLGKKGEAARSNKLMRWRLVSQVIALMIFTLILFLGRKS